MLLIDIRAKYYKRKRREGTTACYGKKESRDLIGDVFELSCKRNLSGKDWKT